MIQSKTRRLGIERTVRTNNQPTNSSPPEGVRETGGRGILVGAPREFLPEGTVRELRTHEQLAAAVGLSLDYPASKVGTVGNATVYYDPALGAQGLSLAQQFLGVVNRPYVDMETFFGINGGAVSVIIATPVRPGLAGPSAAAGSP